MVRIHRLKLSKESLRNLDASKLTEAAGGASDVNVAAPREVLAKKTIAATCWQNGCATVGGTCSCAQSSCGTCQPC